jgi:hypothetical protein
MQLSPALTIGSSNKLVALGIAKHDCMCSLTFVCIVSAVAFGWDSCQKNGQWYQHILSKVPDLQVCPATIHTHLRNSRSSTYNALWQLLRFIDQSCQIKQSANA